MGGEDPDESLVGIALRSIAEGTELICTHSRLHDEETRRSHERDKTGHSTSSNVIFLHHRKQTAVTKHEVVSEDQWACTQIFCGAMARSWPASRSAVERLPLVRDIGR